MLFMNFLCTWGGGYLILILTTLICLLLALNEPPTLKTYRHACSDSTVFRVVWRVEYSPCYSGACRCSLCLTVVFNFRLVWRVWNSRWGWCAVCWAGGSPSCSGSCRSSLFTSCPWHLVMTYIGGTQALYTTSTPGASRTQTGTESVILRVMIIVIEPRL